MFIGNVLESGEREAAPPIEASMAGAAER